MEHQPLLDEHRKIAERIINLECAIGIRGIPLYGLKHLNEYQIKEIILDYQRMFFPQQISCAALFKELNQSAKNARRRPRYSDFARRRKPS